MAVHGLFEDDHSFCLGDAVNVLDSVGEEVHEVAVIAGINLDEHRVGTCCEVAFNDFGNIFQFAGDFAVKGAAFKFDPDESASVKPEFVGIDGISGAGDDVEVHELLDALVDSGSGDAAHFGHFLGRRPGIAHDDV